MDSPFSFIELQLLYQLWTNSSDEEIALMLERPVSEVKEKIHELTGGQPSPYLAKLAKKSVEKHNREVKLKAARVQRDTIRDQKRIKEKFESEESRRIRKLIAQQESDRRKKNEVRESKFKTRIIDFTQLISVRVDEKTIIWVKPGTDITQLRHNYLERERAKKKSFVIQRWKPVAKFK
jgi:hypothetical protein